MRSVLSAKVLGLALFTLSLPLVGCGSEEEESSPPEEVSGTKSDNKKSSSTSNDESVGSPSGAPTSEPQQAPPTTETPKSSAPAEEKPNSTTCTAARDLGKLSGDTGSPSMTVQGRCSQWLRLRVTEDQSSALAAGEKLTITLVPPTGADFDLNVHMTSEADVVDCVTPKMTSATQGDKTEAVKLVWGEELTANNADDSRNIAIEVRSKSGLCADQTWTLLLQGNQ